MTTTQQTIKQHYLNNGYNPWNNGTKNNNPDTNTLYPTNPNSPIRAITLNEDHATIYTYHDDQPTKINYADPNLFNTIQKLNQSTK